MTNSQSPQRPDLQDLVAYIQGRGNETLRAQVLRRLDEDEAYMDLMIDLVPMLREAGECVDPDAEIEPATAPLRLVAPHADAPAPAVVAAPAAGKATPAPDPSRRRMARSASIAALIPIAVAVWLVGQGRLETPRLVAQKISGAKLPGALQDPLYSASRGAGLLPQGVEKEDRFASGARLVDLELAIQDGDVAAAKDRLKDLKDTLGSDERLETLALETELGKSTISQKILRRELDSIDRALFGDEASRSLVDQGACVRGAWLAVQNRNGTFGEDRKIRNRCQALVGPAWPADEKLLADMLVSRSVETPNQIPSSTQ